MTLEIAFLLGLLVVMAALFLTEKLPIELTAFAGLVTLVLLGLVRPEDAFSGFSSPAVITMLSMFFLSSALMHTGVADWIGQKVQALLGDQETGLVATIMAASALLSSVVFNIAATAVILPAVASIARNTRVSPSRVFMPLSFGAILGGTTTLVGTPPNILVAEMIRERGLEPVGFFDFTPMGAVIVGAGILYMVIVAPRLLPRRASPSSVSRQSDLVQVYRLHETLFSIRVPGGSRLDGRTLRESSLGAALGLQVVGIVRDGKRRLAPDPDSVLLAGDVLMVEGNATDLRELYRIQGSEFVEAAPEELVGGDDSVTGLVATLSAESPLSGKTLGDIDFRERFGAIVIGIRREGTVLGGAVGREPLGAGDELLALGTRGQIAEEALRESFEVSGMGPHALDSLQGHLYVLSVPTGSALDGTTIGGSRIGELAGLTISGILRGEQTLLGLEPSEQILAGDRLIVTGSPGRIRSLLDLGEVELRQDVSEESLVSDGVGVVEAVVPPRSGGAGKTLAELDFRQKHSLQVLGLWRDGQLIHTGLAGLALRFGDALLLQGPWEKIRAMAGDPDFLILSESVREERRVRKAPYALGALLLMVTFVITGFQPIHVAAFTGATLVVLTRAISMADAYRAVEWRAVFVVAAVLPVGMALETTGAAGLLSDTVLAVAGPFGPYAVLAALALLSSLLSQALDGAPAVVLLTPVAIGAADQLGISPIPVLMGVALAASAAFMTPFSHKANLLVMGAGGYRVADFLKVGTPLTLLVLGLIVALVPVLFPF